MWRTWLKLLMMDEPIRLIFQEPMSIYAPAFKSSSALYKFEAIGCTGTSIVLQLNITTQPN
jgi:hypothetical protein